MINGVPPPQVDMPELIWRDCGGFAFCSWLPYIKMRPLTVNYIKLMFSIPKQYKVWPMRKQDKLQKLNHKVGRGCN